MLKARFPGDIRFPRTANAESTLHTFGIITIKRTFLPHVDMVGDEISVLNVTIVA